MTTVRRPPKDPVCPRCSKRTLHLAWAGPDWDDMGEPDDMWVYEYDCVQCDGGRNEYGMPPSEEE